MSIMAKSISTTDITFCIKTIHRPWSCHRLVKSLREHIAEPTIVVVDDGQPELRFSEKYPETAKHCTFINLDRHDVGVGVGRNAAIDAAQTEYIFLLDDDHVVTADFQIDRVCEYFTTHELDILAVRQGGGGRPTMLSPLMNGKRIWMHRGEKKRVGTVAWCDMVSNAFLARKETIATLRWDEALKTYEHWEFFYRASHLANLQIAVATDCSVVHAHVAGTGYRDLRGRSKFRAMGLRKHGFHSLRYPGGQIVRA
ncbi:MAG TPA: beta-1,4 N-acetylgalactosaminyltransferase [Rhodopirellula baltica]|uniref:Probable beta-1,4 N-acetylgalactosaminyltransferase n=2 Tax=Rhodopirellula baltica TaxID=265606 RepID=Q7UE71_RHOBA|nr:probable beta-1,4 N-acetylgalactosaminyltransferase [Rhodopirellula baltica SH 1]HBE62248.1 beta-1,4 N-acetylgalactosaminyltransferase [Rhodopirellula baltica]